MQLLANVKWHSSSSPSLEEHRRLASIDLLLFIFHKDQATLRENAALVLKTCVRTPCDFLWARGLWGSAEGFEWNRDDFLLRTNRLKDSVKALTSEVLNLLFQMLKNTTSFFFFSPSSPEMFRKSSLGNDETDKEKKKFLGFFKVNKRSGSKVVACARDSGVKGVSLSGEFSKELCSTILTDPSLCAPVSYFR